MWLDVSEDGMSLSEIFWHVWGWVLAVWHYPIPWGNLGELIGQIAVRGVWLAVALVVGFAMYRLAKILWVLAKLLWDIVEIAYLLASNALRRRIRSVAR